jgi:pre-mRNA-splicing factor 18
MDFSALLANEIAKKKNIANKAATSSNQASSAKSGSAALGTNKKKYLTKAQLEQAELELQAEKQRELDEARAQAAQARKRRIDEERAANDRKRQKLEEKRLESQRERVARDRANQDQAKVEGLEESKMTDEELTKEFRARGEPVTLFAERRSQRVLRLHDLNQQAKRDEQEQREEELEQTINMEISEPEIKSDSDKVYTQMRATIRTLLSEWRNIITTPDHNDDTASPSDNKNALEVLAQTEAYCQPLLQQLRQKALPKQLYPKLAMLLMYIQQHRYREANDVYIQISIGNAAWPIGVTAVGIHARSARERITGYGNENDENVQVAHIMSDDATRKWLIAIKRFITFAEGHLTKKSFKS